MYAVCVIWPLRLDPTIGLAAGGLVAIGILAGYFAGLVKRMKAVA
ncbi:MAG: hypothetical protein ACE5LG_08800 [Anaerolineae bacterium]